MLEINLSSLTKVNHEMIQNSAPITNVHRPFISNLKEMMNGAYDSYFAAMIGNAGLFTAIGDGTPVLGNGNFIWPSDASTYVHSPYVPRPGVGVVTTWSRGR